MIEVQCPEYFQTVTEFAKSLGLGPQLAEQLEFLKDYAGGQNTCKLYKDFAPHSFRFTMYHPDGSYWFNGGLIYQGPDSPADGSFPSLTVSSAEGTGWFVHT